MSDYRGDTDRQGLIGRIQPVRLEGYHQESRVLDPARSGTPDARAYRGRDVLSLCALPFPDPGDLVVGVDSQPPGAGFVPRGPLAGHCGGPVRLFLSFRPVPDDSNPSARGNGLSSKELKTGKKAGLPGP